MCRCNYENVGYLSKLSFSLSLSDVSLTALKLQADRKLQSIDFESAELLKQHFIKCLSNMIVPDDIPKEDMPDNQLRLLMQETFASMGPICTTYELEDRPLLEEIVELLNMLINNQSLAKERAYRLGEIIERLDKTEEAPPFRPDLELTGD